VNDYTPLHHAAARDDAEAVLLLLAHGADPSARTRIDDRTTPLEEAERGGCSRAAAALRSAAP
jgi:ankyrin repeat protein